MNRPFATDILVIGGGPAGASAAYWAAASGHQVTVIEQRERGRDRVCGDALTPGAVGTLYDMGLQPALAGAHRHAGLRMSAHGRSIELPWPTDAGRPDHGLGIRRSANIEKVCRISTREFNNVNGSHSKSCTVHHATDVSV